jgi:CubicO group peptidase (beta-lactamase class C family)
MSYLTFPHPALRAAAAAAIIAAGAMAGAAETGDSRYMTPTMINARAHMFDPNLNWMTFQHLDQMFATRTVTASAETWEIPQSDLTLDGEFTVNGETYDLDGALEATSGNALVVLKDGKLVSETYRNGSDASTRFLTFSVAKSYVATLIGLAATDGLIDSIDDPVTKYLPELAGSGYDGATIEDLLRMRSGVEWLEVYEFGSDTQLTHVHDSALVGYEYRWCDYARDQSVKSDAAPGARFN